MRGILIIIAVAVGLMIFGAQKVYVYVANTSPTKIRCSEFTEGRPTGAWVEISNCWIDYEHAISLESKVLKVDKGTFVPVRPAMNHGARSVLLLEMKTSDVEGRIRASLANVPGGMRVTGENIPPETLQGMLRVGMDTVDSKVKRALDNAAAEARVGPEWQVLQEGETPSVSDLPIGAGMFLAPPLLFGLWVRSKMKGSKEPAGTAAGGGMPPPLPVPPMAPIPPTQR